MISLLFADDALEMNESTGWTRECRMCVGKFRYDRCESSMENWDNCMRIICLWFLITKTACYVILLHILYRFIFLFYKSMGVN